MLVPRKQDTIHKAWLLRLLSAIADNYKLMKVLRFKGGTCSAMRGLIDRFSIDLDFDLIAELDEIKCIRQNLENVFKKIGLEIKDKSLHVPQYFLKYPAKVSERNTIKVDILLHKVQANRYEPVVLYDIDRIFNCQTIDTLVANKFVCPLNRFERNGSIAGRDFFDIHSYLLKGLPYNRDVIVERSKVQIKPFFDELRSFVEKHLTQTIIDQDLNHLLPNESFQKIRKILKTELMQFLSDEIKRLKNKAIRG